MSNNSIIEHRGSYYFVSLREEYLIICLKSAYQKQGKEGSKSRASAHCKAFILDILEHWTNTKRGKGEGLAVFMTYHQWSESMYDMFGRTTIIDSLDELIGDGLISKEPYKMMGNKDTYQYRLNYQELNKRIKQLPERNPNDTHPKWDASQMKSDASQMKRDTHPKRDAHPSQKKHNIDTNIDTNIDSKNKDSAEGKNDAGQQNPNKTKKQNSFSRSSSSQSSFSEEKGPKEVVFTEKQMIVYKLAEERKYSRLKKDAKHQEHCQILAEADVLTQERMESLEQFCREKLSYKGVVDLCLGNLVAELNGWLQVQRLTQQTKPLLVGQLPYVKFSDRGRYGLPPVSSTAIDIATTIHDAGTTGIETTDDHIIEKISRLCFGYKDDGDLDVYIDEIWNIRDKFGLDNDTLYDVITNAYRGTLRLNDASMQDFFEELHGLLTSQYQSVS